MIPPDPAGFSPPGCCRSASVRAVRLSLLGDGERARVVSLQLRGPLRGQTGSQIAGELRAAGILPDRELTVLNRQPGGAVLVSIDGHRYAISGALACRIWVRLLAGEEEPGD